MAISRTAAALVFIFAASRSFADRLDDYVTGYMKQRNIPAVVWGVFKDGKVVKSRAYGLANVELNVPASTNNVFEIGSVSKQFTATALLMFYEEGKIKLEDRIDQYIADLPESWRSVTIRQLLSHTSGIPDIEEIFGYDSYRNIYTVKQIIDVANSKPMDFRPGGSWHYSNTGYFLLGQVLEKVSGKPYGTLLKERIFVPLGMSHTRESDPTEVIPNRAAGYQRTKSGGLGNRDAMQPTACSGAGTIVSNLEDMAKWDAAITHHRFLKAATQEMMWTAAQTSSGPVDYGFGWFISPWRGHPSVEHSGGTAGYSCDFRRFHDSGISVMVFTNLYATGVEGIVIRAADSAVPGLSLVSSKPIAEPPPSRREMFLKAMADVGRGGSGSPYITEAMWKAYSEPSHRIWKDRLADLKRFELMSHEQYAPRKTALGESVVETFTYRLVTSKDTFYVVYMLTAEGKIALQTRLEY